VKDLFLFFISFFVLNVFSQKNNLIPVNFKINDKGEEIEVFFSLKNFEEHRNFEYYNNFVKILVERSINKGEIGKPSLPTLNTLLEIPFKAKVLIELKYFETDTIKLSKKIYPYQPSIRKDEKEINFYYDSASYNSDFYFYDSIVRINVKGIIRDKNIALLSVTPFRYNPSRDLLVVYKNLKFVIKFYDYDLQMTKNFKKRYSSILFNTLLSKFVINSKISLNIPKEYIVFNPIKYLIISDRIFEDVLANFIMWKKQLGYIVKVVYTDEIGNTTEAIKNYIQSEYYNENEPPISYLLIVGDVNQVPAFSGTTGSHVTDLYYATMNGVDDHFPDFYVGRLSASNTTQLQAILNKLIEYERFNLLDSSYLQYSLLVAGVDNYYASTYGNGQINYANTYYTNIDNGIISYTYLYESGSPIVSNSPLARPAILENLNNGVGFVNYTGHCSEQGWGDPVLSNSDVSNLQSFGKYSFFINNCCLSNKFNVNECFGEALLRAQQKGAIGVIGGSNLTYWDEDYYYSVGVKEVTPNPIYDSLNLGFYDRLFHTHGEEYLNWFITSQQINFAGSLSVEQSGSSYNKYYWEVYHLLGDPSLMPFLKIPDTLFASYPEQLTLGTQYVTILTEPYSYIAITKNYNYVSSGFTLDQNSLTLPLSSVTEPCTLDVVILKQNKIPHLGKIIIVSDSVPFVVLESFSINDTGIETNSVVEYSEIVYINPVFKNFGLATADSLTIKLSTNNQNIEILDSICFIDEILPQEGIQVNNAFSFKVNYLIENNTIVNFDIQITDNEYNVWYSSFTITLNAPKLSFVSYEIEDSIQGNNNKRLDEGEIAIIKIKIKNIGNSITPTGIANLTTENSIISIIQQEQQFESLKADSLTELLFLVQVNNNINCGGTYVLFSFIADANGYSVSEELNIPVSLIVEDFESGNFFSFNWNTDDYGDAPWYIIQTDQAYEGSYCMRSGNIGDGTFFQNTISDISLSITLLYPDTFSFYKKVSSEENYDFLVFFINNEIMGEWSGEVPWSQEKFYLNSGTNILKWRYTKDVYYSHGSDAAYVDFIVLPCLTQTNFVDANLKNKFIIAYPNPFTDLVQLKLYNFENLRIVLSLYDLYGSLIFSESLYITSNDFSHMINLFNVSKGIYKLKVYDKENCFVFPLVKMD